MSKYKIVQKFGYTHSYKDGEEVKHLQSIEFSRKNVDEIATLTVKVLCPEVEIEIDNNNQELIENKTPNISVEIGGRELINKANTILLNGNVIEKKELAEDESINSKTIQSPQETISKTISETLTDDVIVKKELAEMKEILSELLEIQNTEFNMKYGYLCNNKSGRISFR